MKILAIETSCDETAISIIDSAGFPSKPRIKILSNVVLSQIPIHKKFGGVVPNLAKREHQKNLVPLLLRALREAGLFYEAKHILHERQPAITNRRLSKILSREPELFLQMNRRILNVKPPKIDAIAVTVGPGLEPALWAGVNFTRALSLLWKKLIIPVNHLEGHIYTAILGNNPPKKKWFPIHLLKPPAMALIVSGGHTELVLMSASGGKKNCMYTIVGETRDDAAGEAFDKVAKMLGLGYPGGPEIAREAEKLPVTDHQLSVSLPRPMMNAHNFDFSFSGLKTAVLYFLRDAEKKYPLHRLRSPVAKEFQNAVVDVLVAKTLRAAREYNVKSVILGGGVAANELLRETLGRKLKQHLPRVRYQLPVTNFTGDNALMIALAACFSKNAKKIEKDIRADAGLRLGE